MNFKAMAISLTLSAACIAAAPAYARSTTAFSAFHVEAPVASNPYSCVVEDNGAAVNMCSFPVSMEFDLPIDNAGNHPITVQDYWKGQDNFYCQSYAYTGRGQGFAGTSVTFAAPLQTFVSNVNESNNMSIQLICWNVPPSGGVANINWSV